MFDKEMLDKNMLDKKIINIIIFILLAIFSLSGAAEKVKNVESKQKKTTQNECANLITQKKYYDALDVCKAKAKKEDSSAQFNLGILYYQGLGVMSDKRIAIKWLNKAAANNHSGAQYNLGIMTANGIGIDANLLQAYAWLTLAKVNGYKDAESALKKMAEELSDKEKQQAAKIVEAFRSKN